MPLVWRRWSEEPPQKEPLFQPRPEGQVFGPPPDWDYRTAQTGFEGEPLPEGAVGWTAQGEPYFGYGNIPIVGNAIEWGRRAWERINAPTLGPTTEKPTGIIGKALSLVRPLGEGTEAGKQPTIGQKAARGVGEVIRGAGEALSTPAYAVEQGLAGVSEGLQAGGEGSALPDIEAQIQEAIPNVEGRGFLSDATQFLESFVTNLNPILMGYNAIRFLTSPMSAGQKRDILADNIAAARIAYSAWSDPALKQEFIRRYNAGEDPYLLQMEMMRPGAELIGQLVLDPLNLVGGWLSKPGKAAELTRGARVADELKPFVKAVAEAGTEAATTDALRALNEARMANVVERGTRLTNLQRQTGLLGLTANGKRYVVGEQVGDVLQYVFGLNKNNPEDAIDLLEALVRSVSSNSDEALDGLTRLMHDEALANIYLSDDFTDTGVFLRKMLENEKGELAVGEFLDSLKKVDNYEDMVRLATSKADKAIEEAFPTIREAATATDKIAELEKAGQKVPNKLRRWAALGDEMGDTKKALAAIDDVAQRKFYQPINRFFANVYMGYNPGYAFRNAFQNYVHMFIDEPGAVPKNIWATLSGHPRGAVGRAEEGALKWLGDFKPGMLEQGMTQVKGAVRGVSAKGPTARFSDWFERGSGASVYSKSVEDSMRAMLKPGRGLPDIGKLVDAGLEPRAAGYLSRLVVDNYGDVKAAGQAFREALATGQIDAWRTMDWLDPRAARFLEKFPAGGQSLMAKVMEALQDVKSPEDVRESIGKILALYQEEAANATKHGVPLILKDTPDDVVDALVWALGDIKGIATDDARSLLAAIQTSDHLAIAGPDGYLEAISKMPGGAPVVQQLQRRWQTMRSLSKKTTQEYAAVWNDKVANAPKGELIKGSEWASKHWADWAKELFGLWDETVKDIANQAEMFAELQRPLGVDVDGALANARKFLAEADEWHNAQYVDGQFVVRGAPEAGGVATQGMPPAKSGMVYRTIDEAELADIRASGQIRSKNNLALPEEKQLGLTAFADSPADTEMYAGIRSGQRYVVEVKPTETMRRDYTELPGVLKRKNELVAEIEQLRATLAEGKLPEDQVEMFRKWLTSDQDELAQVTKRLTDSGIPEEKLVNLESRRLPYLQSPEGVPSENISRVWEVSGDTWREVPLAPEATGAAEKLKTLTPPASDALVATPARTVDEMLPDIENALNSVVQGVTSQWGETVKVFEDATTEAALKAWEREATSRVSEARWMAKKVADAQRKFTLLSYPEKKGFDTVLGYIFPYQFWYTRTYANWMKRLADNPVILAGWAKYRRTLENIHAGAPDWWKYNVNTNELLGLDAENPLYFNLEATLNPLNGMTGVDFNDEQKRGTWFETLLDDMGKFGPTTWTPFSIATAIAAYMRGDEEAAARWGGRLFPQTATVKGALGLLRHKVSDLPLQGEYDLFVHLFSGGMDPYERKRVGRALGMLVDQGQIDQATARDAARTQSGPAWDMALDLAVNQRGPGQLASFMFGAGLKARNQSDIEIDQFWADYGRLWNMEPNLSPEEFKQGMDDLRNAYPFMDAVLISRKGTIARDRAYAYSVLGDIPPSMSDNFAEWAGIPQGLLGKFYDDKGAIDQWSEADRSRFMAGIIDIGAVIDVPDEATRADWRQARNRYNQVIEEGKRRFGDDIWDRVDLYYGSKGDTPQSQQNADLILRMDPAIGQALDFKSAAVTNDPLLFDYYASLGQIESYWKGIMYSDIEDKAGMPIADIWRSWDEYYRALPGSERKAYWSEHPELEIYSDTRKSWLPTIDSKVAEFGSKLRDIPIDVREGAGGTYGQEAILSGIENQQRGFPQLSWQEWQGVLGDSLARIVLDNAVLGDDLPKSAQGRLDDIAEEMGLPSGDAVLMLAVQSVQAP